jgi:phosphatidylinositol alpha-1,6-mannosyltransferase
VSTRKGQLQVIRLLPVLKQRFPDIHYHCIGIPTEAADFIAQAKDLGVAEQITFHGAVSDNALKSMLLATDVFVMLSTESKTGDVEGFGIAILEANALGIPAIGAKGCGIEDAMQNYKSGILINPKEEQEIVEAFQTIMENINSYQTNASQWARRFAWDKVILDYVKLI